MEGIWLVLASTRQAAVAGYFQLGRLARGAVSGDFACKPGLAGSRQLQQHQAVAYAQCLSFPGLSSPAGYRRGVLKWLCGLQSKDTPFKTWADPARIRKYETFFGGDLNAEVIKVL